MATSNSRSSPAMPAAQPLVKGAVLAAVAGLGALLAWRWWRTPRSVRPGINAPFADPSGDGAAFLERFETESREIYVKSARVVALLDIKPGMRVADLGAGTGLFMRQLAAEVAGPTVSATDAGDQRGTVFLLEPYVKFLRHLRGRRAQLAAEAPQLAARVHIAQSSFFSMDPPQGAEGDVEPEEPAEGAAGTRIPDGSLDLVLSTDSYHHYEFPSLVIASVRRKLRVGGRFAILDFEREEGKSSAWVMGHVRAGRETVRKEIEAQGLVYVNNVAAMAGLQENYLMIFEKKF